MLCSEGIVSLAENLYGTASWSLVLLTSPRSDMAHVNSLAHTESSLKGTNLYIQRDELIAKRKLAVNTNHHNRW